MAPTAVERKPRLGVALAIIFGLVLLYVLSVGPASALLARESISIETYGTVYSPLWWLHDRSPTVRDALHLYCRLWIPNGWR